MPKKSKSKTKRKLKDPELYFNRELSWLEFNDRVLQEGCCEQVPLLERLKFLGIVSSNLDEFFMVRVAGLKQQKAAGLRKRDLSGRTPNQQLQAISERVTRMAAEQSAAIAEVTRRLREHGMYLLELDEVDNEQRRFLRSLFLNEIAPTLTPLGLDDLDPGPLLPGLTLYVALLLRSRKDDDEPDRVAVAPVPAGQARFITLPAENGLHLVRLEDVIADNAGTLFPGSKVAARTVFRITRDADVSVESEDAADLLQTMEEAVLARRRRGVVRLTISAGTHRSLRKRLVDYFEVGSEDVYDIEGIIDAKALMGVASRPGFDELKYDDWPPQPARDLLDSEDLYATLREQDVLLMHPYERFDPVVHFVERAAEDPDVLAIKMTLYRTSGGSPIIAALERAAEAGKEVAVLVELKARFDESRNVGWARRLEDAGCLVIYGVAGYKTHSKALLVVRRESHRIRRYVHLATGNYNDKTAKLYSDIGLMSTDPDLTADAAAFFNVITGYSQPVGWHKLTIAPTGLRNRFYELIDREIQASTPDRPGLIVAKVNSLQDRGIIRGLYRASQAGVRVRLNVRGICCLRPGVKGVSENIEVVSIIDRYLEHARVYFFRNGGHEEVYLSSADWMVRNIDKRLETLFPIQQADLKRRLVDFLETCMSDNLKGRILRTDGSWELRTPGGDQPVRAQETFQRQAEEAAAAAGRRAPEFRPLSRPE